ncbi:nucleotide exchange factor GrpE [Natronorubrum thiooxidans]|uniref:Protein GrpE n=1 Tax=Natronorubrum thiooxidans TaxID=308853 RepID=A0A1N7EIW4_9EURY|nr:nucleotide exchange factor GrpE [Natronorubrum thiooxidans]SIR88036.1 molecular chaperone GrpE [Natronorubrum thiooxidans]
MSEDEGTNATAQGVPSEEQSDDGETADVESGASGPDGSAVEADSPGTDSPAEESESNKETTTGSVAASNAEAAIPETSADVQELLDRVSEYDDDLAHQVTAVVEDARAVNATVADQREELEDLSERVAEQAETIGELQDDLEEANTEIDDLQSRLKRKQADFQNYKKRAKKRQQQIKDRATEDLVERLLGVRDNMKRALEEESGDADSLRDGVEMTLREFDRVLEDENVSEIDPEPGTESDPQRHEVMMQVDSAQPEGTIADVFTPGYEMGEKVIQNAQVTVSNGELEGDVDENDSETAADSDDGGAGDEDAADETTD